MQIAGELTFAARGITLHRLDDATVRVGEFSVHLYAYKYTSIHTCMHKWSCSFIYLFMRGCLCTHASHASEY